MEPGDRSTRGPGSHPASGTTIAGKYRVDGVLGKGGMGVVLAATHLHLREKVAIKLLHATRLAYDGAIERFMREARAASRIRGEHVVRVHDVGLLDDGTPYLVMEHLEGVDLSAYVARSGPLPAEEAVDYVLQACEALREAHAQGIIHRDLKPANLFLTRRLDGSACVKVLDFGVSKTAELSGLPSDDESHAEPRLVAIANAETLDGPPAAVPLPEHRETAVRAQELTRSGAAIGSPRYMAPEQMTSPREVDARADVWSLGAVLFELVTGRAAFGADSLEGVVQDVMAARFTRLRQVAPRAPGALDAVVARCLAVDPNERFDGVASLARALAPFGPGRRTRRRRIAWGVAASMVAAIAAASFVGLLPRRADPPPSRPAEASRATLVIAGAPVPLAHGGDCAELPSFASDGSILSLASRGSEHWIERVAAGAAVPRTVVSCPGTCWYPAPDGDGRVVYAAVADVTSMGLELRSASLDGSDDRLEALRGRSSWRAGPSLFFVREDQHAILRHATDGSVDETLVEAPSARTFRALALSPDGSMLAVTSMGLESRVFADVCFGPASPGTTLDCTTAGESSSQRPSFAPDGHSIYFARGRTLVRFDPRSGALDSTALPFAATSLAVAPAGDRVVASTCEPGLELRRWSGGSTLTPLPPIDHAGNELALGPHGEMAYPMIVGDDVQLVVADESGEHTRVLTSGSHRVTEAAYSPDGRRVAFQDAAKERPGVFVMEASGARSPIRLSEDPGDGEIGWLDDERILFLHPVAGYAYGRLDVVSAGGGAPVPFWNADGIFLGVERAHRTVLLVDWSADGTRFCERSLDGKQREVVFAGAPRGMSTSFSGVSVSGRYVTWIGGGGAWLGDVEAGRAVRVPLDPKEVQPLALYADDEGRAVVASRVRRGGLFAVPGVFP